MIEQVDVGERKFGNNINPAKILVEFDAVERRDPVVDQYQIAEMKIAVAFTHAPGQFAGEDPLSAACKLVVRPSS